MKKTNHFLSAKKNEIKFEENIEQFIYYFCLNRIQVQYTNVTSDFKQIFVNIKKFETL